MKNAESQKNTFVKYFLLRLKLNFIMKYMQSFMNYFDSKIRCDADNVAIWEIYGK